MRQHNFFGHGSQKPGRVDAAHHRTGNDRSIKCMGSTTSQPAARMGWPDTTQLERRDPQNYINGAASHHLQCRDMVRLLLHHLHHLQDFRNGGPAPVLHPLRTTLGSLKCGASGTPRLCKGDRFTCNFTNGRILLFLGLGWTVRVPALICDLAQFCANRTLRKAR